MVMYHEVRDYQQKKHNLKSADKAVVSTRIMEGFREKGWIPGAYKPIWSTYERRLNRYKSRMAKRSARSRFRSSEQASEVAEREQSLPQPHA